MFAILLFILWSEIICLISQGCWDFSHSSLTEWLTSHLLSLLSTLISVLIPSYLNSQSIFLTALQVSNFSRLQSMSNKSTDWSFKNYFQQAMPYKPRRILIYQSEYLQSPHLAFKSFGQLRSLKLLVISVCLYSTHTCLRTTSQPLPQSPTILQHSPSFSIRPSPCGAPLQPPQWLCSYSWPTRNFLLSANPDLTFLPRFIFSWGFPMWMNPRSHNRSFFLNSLSILILAVYC